MNVKGIEVTLVTRCKADAMLRGQTLTQWVMSAMEARLEGGRSEAPLGRTVQSRPLPEKVQDQHDRKACRVYGCLMCAAAKERNG